MLGTSSGSVCHHDSIQGEEGVEEKEESARVERLRWGTQRSQSGSRTGIRIGTRDQEALSHSVQIALVEARARRGVQMRRCGQRVIGSASAVIQAQASTASGREWPAAILGCRGVE